MKMVLGCRELLYMCRLGSPFQEQCLPPVSLKTDCGTDKKKQSIVEGISVCKQFGKAGHLHCLEHCHLGRRKGRKVPQFQMSRLERAPFKQNETRGR